MPLRNVALMAFALTVFADPCAGAALENVQQGNPQAQHVLAGA
jgi:hypothetical protein